ncbi:MAG: uncharacterized protein JWM21_1914 [Acidobacteria bacterium]|nr:uncharacterized protein [Acidobacteriota bacterium]
MPINQLRNAVVVTVLSVCVLTALWSAGVTSHAALPRLNDKGAPAAAPPVKSAKEESARLRASDAYGQLPLSFEINRGQTNKQVKFLSRGAGYNLFLTASEAVLSLERSRSTGERANDVMRMKLVGSNRSPKIEGSEELPGKTNYFIGNNPKTWRTNVSTFARVHYRGVYPGVDVVYYGNQRKLENDFIVAPGANPDVIVLAFDGANKISIDKESSLVLSLAGGDVQLQKPVLYQLIEGVRREVAGKYVMRNPQEVGFEVGAYDRTRPLVIDPVLIYSFPLVGSSMDSAAAIAVDSSGNAYIAGFTRSANFPTASALDPTIGGLQDVFISKINAAGSALVYSTFLGGSLDDSGYDLTIDGAGNAYVVGRTSSTDFPTVNAFDSTYSSSAGSGVEDAFVARLNPAGSALVYSTYLSGQFGARGYGIATDGAGNAYVTGTTSTNHPVTASAFESTNFNTGFLSKLNTNGSGASSLVYSTFLGHTGSGEGRAIAADATGNVYITGNLGSTATNFATAGAFQTTYGGGTQDAYVEKFNTNLSGAASRVYATYLGGSDQDFGGSAAQGFGKAIAIDAAGNAYITGQTKSTNFPTLNAFQPANGGPAGSVDAFLTKLNQAGSALIYSTYLGGNGTNADEGRGVAVNVVGNAYVTGATNSANFPTTTPPPTLSTTGGIFLTKFSPSGTPLQYSTRLVSGAGDLGIGVALDGAGNAFVTGTSGSDVLLNEIADPTIIGRVVDEDNNPIAGATVNLAGVPSATTTTDTAGYYTFGLLTSGNSYTVSVTVANYIFNSQAANNLARNVRLDFSPVVISIGGQVTLGAGGLDAVTMTLSGGKSLMTATDAGGNYGFANLPAGRSYTVTPAKAGFGFLPTSSTFNNVLANQTANFAASATFQFSVGSYVASETAGSALITIQRTSGASGPASVDFLTSNGTASQRTDYTITIGRLNFATGDTVKTFRVPIVDDLYVEGDETINVTLSNPVGATLGTPNPALVTITDNDSVTATTNPLEDADARFFVRQHYLDFLNRVPDQGGFDFWSAKITVCGSDAACIRANRVGVSNSFFFELEYQQTGSYVQRLYRAAYGNNQPFPNTQTNVNFPNEEKKMPNYSVFSVDRAAVVGGGNLAQKQLDLANTFVGRAEFTARYPASLSTAPQFVDAVLGTIQTDLGVNLSGERNNLITLYNSLGRGGVMYRLADDNVQTNPINNRSLIDAEYNRSFVLGEYFGYLRRNPDIAGFVFWLGQVNSGPLRDVTKQSAMVCSFITSDEYQLRFSPVAPRNNTECP